MKGPTTAQSISTAHEPHSDADTRVGTARWPRALLLVLTTATITLGGPLAAHSLWQAAELARAAQSAATESHTLLQRRDHLLTLPKAPGFGPRPGADAGATLRAALTKVGLTDAVLTKVDAPAEGPATGFSGPARRTVTTRLTLDGLTLPELGALLRELQADPAWTVQSAHITTRPPPSESATGSAAAGNIPRELVRAELVLQATFAERPTPNHRSSR